MGWAGGWDGYWKVKAVGNDIEMEARTCGAILEGDGSKNDEKNVGTDEGRGMMRKCWMRAE